VAGRLVSVGLEQALAWRLRRHHLAERDGGDAVDVVRRLCGVQAQVNSAAALAVAVRQAKPDPEATTTALRERELVRTWAMRGTLHLLAPDDAAAYLTLLAGARSWHKGSWQKTYLTVDEMAALTDAVGDALAGGEELTREELVAKIRDKSLAEHVGSGWSAVLKPLAWQGLLCQGSPQGNRVTFTRPDAWSPRWRGGWDEDEAARHAVTAYLAAHGPATMAGFDQWLLRNSTPKQKLRRWFADLGDDVVTVDVDGTSAYVLTEHVDELATTKPSREVRLLPGFDQYVLAPGTADTAILDADHRADVSRAAGWIAPVVVANGRVAGTWNAEDGEPRVELWQKVPAAKLAAETKRLARLTTRRAPA
jgi:hypothetical protein